MCIPFPTLFPIFSLTQIWEMELIGSKIDHYADITSDCLIAHWMHETYRRDQECT
jgi:hypothetical protein